MRVRMLLAGLAVAATIHSVAARTAPKTEHKSPSILLVGASGMIGSRILNEASSSGHYVIAAARHPEKIAAGPNIHPVALDATDEKALEAEAKHTDVIVLATSLDTLPTAYRPEAQAMRNFLDTLKASDIDWTFFSPAFTIAPGTRTGNYRLGSTTLLSDAKGESRISAEDYADALVNELERPAHVRAQMTVAY